MNKRKIAVLSAATLILTGLAITGTLAWLTSEKEDSAASGNLSVGNIGVRLKCRSYAVYDNGDGVYDNILDLDGSPIPEPSNIPFYEWPLSSGATLSQVRPPEYDSTDIYKDRIAALYPGGFYGEDGYPVSGVKGVIEYYLSNYSGADAIIRVNQSGLWFTDQARPAADQVQSVDLRWYRLKEEFIYYDDPPVSLINPEGSLIPFVDYTKLIKTPAPSPYTAFTPYDIFNKYYYTTSLINMPSLDRRTVDYEYENIYGPDGFGLMLDTDIVLDDGVKLAANGAAKRFYIYMPKDVNARFLYIFTAMQPAAVNSVVKNFRNDWTYSVLALDTDSADPQNNPELSAHASGVNQEEFEYLFGNEDSYTVNDNFQLDWDVSPPTPSPSHTQTPTPSVTIAPKAS
ncbi:MAG: hypothetical protein LBB94_12535 [Clostridiales bacterium]|jgi:hypothetical protein|nr:hypothetical protein [Clostridiales bacterium]